MTLIITGTGRVLSFCPHGKMFTHCEFCEEDRKAKALLKDIEFYGDDPNLIDFPTEDAYGVAALKNVVDTLTRRMLENNGRS